jgi:pyruvate-ferredoxin/flavodoxin oxidoreductase
VVADNLRVVKRGYTEIHEITEVKKVGAQARPSSRRTAGLPIMLKRLPAGDAGGKVADIHRFWEQTGNFYLTGKGNDNLADPFIGAWR